MLPRDNTYNATRRRMMDEHPTLFPQELDVLAHLFAVGGNGYQWQDGEIVRKNTPPQETLFEYLFITRRNAAMKGFPTAVFDAELRLLSKPPAYQRRQVLKRRLKACYGNMCRTGKRYQPHDSYRLRDDHTWALVLAGRPQGSLAAACPDNVTLSWRAAIQKFFRLIHDGQLLPLRGDAKKWARVEADLRARGVLKST